MAAVVVLAQALAMVGSDDHEAAPAALFAIPRFEQPAELVVGGARLGLVAAPQLELPRVVDEHRRLDALRERRARLLLGPKPPRIGQVGLVRVVQVHPQQRGPLVRGGQELDGAIDDLGGGTLVEVAVALLARHHLVKDLEATREASISAHDVRAHERARAIEHLGQIIRWSGNLGPFVRSPCSVGKRPVNIERREGAVSEITA